MGGGFSGCAGTATPPCADQVASGAEQQAVDVDPQIDGIFATAQAHPGGKDGGAEGTFDHAQDAEEEPRPEGQVKA